MAEAFKSVNADLGTSANTSIYQCPSSTTAIVILCQVANVDGTNAATVTVAIYPNDDLAGTAVVIASTIAVPADSFVVIIDKDQGLYLEEDKSLGVTASAANDLTYTVTYEELS